MPALYSFEDQILRVVFIDDKPWLVAEDLGPCLGLRNEDFAACSQTCEEKMHAKDTVILELENAKGERMPTRLYSLDITMQFASLAERQSARRFRHWLEDVFENTREPIRFCDARDCPHLFALTDRLNRGLLAMSSVIDLVGAIYSSCTQSTRKTLPICLIWCVTSSRPAKTLLPSPADA